ncbi:hypothetical protein GCM10009846_12730 [Agrococcus versicolor]|uniref:PH domain-containing protein n=1 Tax=Agrococcus versicolor TaxID=501482 RepID=A0ABP5ME67_9MICO
MGWQEAGRVRRSSSTGAHPGWPWGIVLVPAGVGLAAGGVALARALDAGIGTAIGVALVAWGATLVMPFVVIAWYAAQAAWKAPREASGAEFRAPSHELRRIGFRIRWSPGARSLVFGSAAHDGRDLPMLVVGRVVHVLGIVVLVVAGLGAALSNLGGR